MSQAIYEQECTKLHAIERDAASGGNAQWYESLKSRLATVSEDWKVAEIERPLTDAEFIRLVEQGDSLSRFIETERKRRA